MLLIVSNKSDIATDFLISRLYERNISFIRINTEDYLSEWDVDFQIDHNNANALISFQNGNTLPVENIEGAYIRQPKLPKLRVTDSDKEFAKRETGEALRSLWRFIKDDVWLNAPHHILRASNKPEQLRIAREIGFTIPKTCITANHNFAYDFYCQNGKNVIAKAVKHGFLYDGKEAKVAGTQHIDQVYFDNACDYANIPMIFQEKIEKHYDIRITVVGNKVFSTGIYSQEHQETSVDWRLADHFKIPLRQEQIEIPTTIEHLCVNITQRMNLKYSAIDMIKSQDGNYYFLELNPNGQWAWLEQVAGHLIRDALIDALINE